MDLRQYIYLDTIGIDDIYNQTIGRVEKECVSTVNESTSKEVKVSGSLKAILLAFVAKADIDDSTEKSRGSSTSTTSSKSSHDKLVEITDRLSDSDFEVCFSSLAEAVRYSSENKCLALFHGKHTFDAPQFYDEDGVDKVNESAYLMFNQARDHYIESDNYYKDQNANIPLDMPCSVNKMKHAQNGAMGHTGHDAVVLRGCKGKNISLSVFCGVQSHTSHSGVVQLKPYALWF